MLCACHRLLTNTHMARAYPQAGEGWEGMRKQQSLPPTPNPPTLSSGDCGEGVNGGVPPHPWAVAPGGVFPRSLFPFMIFWFSPLPHPKQWLVIHSGAFQHSQFPSPPTPYFSSSFKTQGLSLLSKNRDTIFSFIQK